MTHSPDWDHIRRKNRLTNAPSKKLITTRSAFNSHCRACHSPINRGDLVVLSTDGLHRTWIHGQCPTIRERRDKRGLAS